MQVDCWFLWNHQNMSVAHGADVEECQHVVVFPDTMAGDVTTDDLGEYGFLCFTHEYRLQECPLRCVSCKDRIPSSNGHDGP